ncbi:MAG: hypothetical protein J5771_01320, partial [Bacteroidales bacterium]|nr:hypothetical protein [Bacteroidales bacterium]
YRSFENYHFESRVFEGIGERVLLSFNMSAQDPLQTVTMALTGLTPAPGETRLNRVGNTNRYTFTPTNAATNTFQFLTTSASEPVTVALSAPHYYDASVTDDRSKLDFTNPHFDASEYLVGIGRNVTYYFTYDEDYMENIVVVLTGLEPRSGNAGTLELIDGTTDSYAYTPSPGSTGTEALLLQTTGVSDNLSVKIYNTHYSEVTSTANRITYNFASLNISTNNVALGTGQSVAMNFQYQSGLAAQDVTVTLTNLGGSTPTSTSGTLTDNGDGTWNYHPNSTNANQTHYITATTSTYGAHVGISLESDGYNEREATKYRYVTIARQALSMTGGNATANRPRNKTISIRYGANNGSVATTFTGSNANPSLNGSAINWTADRDLTASDVIYLTYYYNNSSNNALWGVQTTLSALVGATNSNSGRLSLQFTQQ